MNNTTASTKSFQVPLSIAVRRPAVTSRGQDKERASENGDGDLDTVLKVKQQVQR